MIKKDPDPEVTRMKTMEKFKIQFDWLNKAFPEGLPIPSSTVIIGPMGTGKPLIALGFVSSWLEGGGNVITATHQFPDPDFVVENLRVLYGIEAQDYKEQLVSVRFDYSADSVELNNQKQMVANLIKPENWDIVVEKAKGIVRKSKLDFMFFSTALNLPLFSATYGDKLMSKIRQMFEANGLIYIFCISTSMLEKKAEKVGKMADNLIEAHVSENPKRLRFEVKKAKNVRFSEGELEAPFSQETLKEAEKRAERLKVVPVKSIKEV